MATPNRNAAGGFDDAAWADTLSCVADALFDILADGELDDHSRSRLAHQARSLNAAAAGFRSIADDLAAPRPARPRPARPSWAPIAWGPGGIGSLALDGGTSMALLHNGRLYTIDAVRSRVAADADRLDLGGL